MVECICIGMINPNNSRSTLLQFASNAACNISNILVGIVPEAVECAFLIDTLVCVCPEEVALCLFDYDSIVNEEGNTQRRQEKGIRDFRT